jgi:hypothetical protein
MTKKIIYIFFILLTACSSSKKITYEPIEDNLNAAIELKSLYLWIDKMPGSDKSNNLRLSADLIIEESGDYQLNELKLAKINVTQDSLLIYNFKPLVKENTAYNKKNRRNIIISTIEKTELPEEFDMKKEVEVKFVFEVKNKKFINTFKKVKVDITY